MTDVHPETDAALVLYEMPALNVARLVLNRPETGNAQNGPLLQELDAAFTRALADNDVHVIILAARGKHFSSGHDLRGTVESMTAAIASQPPTGTWASFDADGAEGWYGLEQQIYLHYTRRWRNLAKPTIAAVQGACAGGGLMLAWACDIIFAADNASFSDPVVDYGMLGVEWFAHPWELGPRKAKEHLFLAKAWDAEEAHRLGMVNHVVAPELLQDAALDMAVAIASKPTFAVRLAKEAVNRCMDSPGQTQAIEAIFALHQLNHQHNFIKFGTLMDLSRVPVSRSKR